MEQKIIIPEITKKFEKLKIENFELKYFEKNKDVTTIIEKQSYGFIKRIYMEGSYFVLIKKYYTNGVIKEKSISFNNGYPIGYWYKFNEEGKLIKEINTDEGYDFGWRKIIAYCEEKEIPLTKGFKEFVGFQTRILKQEENGKKIWVITYLLPVGYKALQITLDGKTGKELKREEFDFIGG